MEPQGLGLQLPHGPRDFFAHVFDMSFSTALGTAVGGHAGGKAEGKWLTTALLPSKLMASRDARQFRMKRKV